MTKTEIKTALAIADRFHTPTVGEELRARTVQLKTLAGYGYMRSREPREPIPDAAIPGYYTLEAIDDPVQIGSYVVAQRDLTAIRQATGELPLLMYTDDYSGSYRYLHAILWTPEEWEAAGLDPATR